MTIPQNEILIGDCREVLKTLPDRSVHCCVTSPPYFNLRSYLPEGHPDKHKEIGIEKTPEEYVTDLVQVLQEVKRVLRDDGTLWLNLASSYAGGGRGFGYGGKSDTNRGTKGMPRSIVPNGLKPKDLIPIPWLVALELQKEGWWLRQDIIWSKNNCLPESVKDRCVKSHEYVLLFSKSSKYYFDYKAIQEPATSSDNNIRDRDKGKLNNVPGRARMQGLKTNKYEFRNKRSVWNINNVPYKGSHFACFPPALVKPCILAGCPENGLVLDPFAGSGTVGEVCKNLGRNAILIELNPEYKPLIEQRAGI